MGRRFVGCVLAVLAAAVLAGGTNVKSLKPVGEKPLAVQADEWDGTWLCDGEGVQIKVLNEEGGVLEAAITEYKKDRFATETHRVELRTTGQWTFANILDDDEPRGYLWVVFRRDGSRILSWEPDAERFKALVASGEVDGSVTKEGDVVLKGLTEAQIRNLLAGPGPVPLKWNDPMVWIRQGK